MPQVPRKSSADLGHHNEREVKLRMENCQQHGPELESISQDALRMRTDGSG